MPALPSNFDATKIDPSAPRDVLPAGEYLAMIVNSEWKRTKAGDGQYLNLEFQVIDGEFSGRKFWDRLNLENPNATAVEIAQRTLSAICHAVERVGARDSEALHNLPLVAKLAVKKTDQGENNEVKGYKAPNGSRPAATAPPPAQRQGSPGAKPAWSR